MIGSYYTKIYRLEYIIRYSNVPRVHDESVASHSFFVAAIVLKLHDKYRFNLGLALQMAISHDMPEYMTNDLSHETKQLFPEIKEVLRKAEHKALLAMPTAVRDGCKMYSDSNLVEAKIVHLADAMQCNQYATNEIMLGNKGYMTEVEFKSASRICELEEHLKTFERGFAENDNAE